MINQDSVSGRRLTSCCTTAQTSIHGTRVPKRSRIGLLFTEHFDGPFLTPPTFSSPEASFQIRKRCLLVFTFFCFSLLVECGQRAMHDRWLTDAARRWLAPGKPNAIRHLLALGADPTMLDGNGCSPIDFASDACCAETVGPFPSLGI